MHANGSQKFSVSWNGQPVSSGLWYVIGGLQNGAIDQDGTYHAPQGVPSPANITVEYIFDGGQGVGTQTGVAQLTVTNPVAIVNSITPATVTQLVTPLYIQGNFFLPSSTVLVQGQPVPTTFVNSTLLKATAVLSAPIRGNVVVGISNPSPGPSVTSVNLPALFPTLTTVSPGTVQGGWITVTVNGTNYTPGSVVTLDGRPMATTMKSPTQVVGYGYLPGWKTGSTMVGVAAQAGTPASGQKALYITPTPITYDVAARFATQAALGPRPGLVEHIQKIGLHAFLTEQFKQPGIAYSDPSTIPRLIFLQAGVTGNSLLRMRLAEAFNAFIPNQAIFLEYASWVPWEKKLEADVTGNFRTLMTDVAADPRMGNFLNLAGNHALSDPNLHPNQNFARELMQLFTIGTTLLNDDGSPQLDGNGQPLPSYDQNTVIDLSRALTGWDLPKPVNPTFTAFGIDESQTLAANDAFHDHGAKLLFGTVPMPAGQNIVQDRTMALNAIFNHPSLPANISRLLIQHLVTSNPSPAYIQRVATAFKDNGRGVRGDLQAVVTAILLDPEARAGDTTPAPNDGFLQDPLLFQLFLSNALQNSPADTQAVQYAAELGQNFWYPNSIFDFYPHQYVIPGTTLNSPEFSLFNNLSALHRSQYVYGFVSEQQPGSGFYVSTSWHFTAFTNLPDLVDGLNHQLYHGQMSAAEQAAILSFCSPIMSQNPQQAYMDAIFLALNADSYNVSH